MIGLRLGGFAGEQAAIEVPFANLCGFVAGVIAQEGGDGNLRLPEVHGGVVGDPIVNPDSPGSASGHEAGAGGGAIGRGGIAIREAEALGGELVQVGGLDDRISVASEVPIAEVIGEEDENVGRGWGGVGDGDEREGDAAEKGEWLHLFSDAFGIEELNELGAWRKWRRIAS